jgi:hypothetical protein
MPRDRTPRAFAAIIPFIVGSTCTTIGFSVCMANSKMLRKSAIRHAHGELGVRLTGPAGAVELFAGAERMVDAYPIDRLPEEWPFAGLRLISR